jgi:hypothetical protein
VLTGELVAVNVALVCPAETVAVAGTLAAALLSCKLITAPPDGAGPLRITVPVELFPPVTVVGLSVTEETSKGLTVNAAVMVALNVADMVTTAGEETTLELTVKVAVVALAATVTLLGTVAAAVLLLDKVTTVPPVGAGPFRVTVPVELVLPPVTVVGLSARDATQKGLTVRFADAVALYVADMVVDAGEETVALVAVKVAVVAPAGTVTLAGTLAAETLLLERLTSAPPDAAGPVSLTVPVELFRPPATGLGDRLTD